MEMDTSDFLQSYRAAHRSLQEKFRVALTLETEFERKKMFADDGISYKERTIEGEGGIYTFSKVKYGITCKFEESFHHASRGTTLISSSKNGQRESDLVFSLNKFFNGHELKRYYGVTEAELVKSLSDQGFKFLYMPKYDGTNIQAFTDRQGVRHCFTLGSVDSTTKMQEIMGESPTFASLASRLLDIQHPKLAAYLHEHPFESVVCELMSPFNVIATKYASDPAGGVLMPLVMIGQNGVPSWDVLAKLCPQLFQDGLPTKCWDFTGVDDFVSVKEAAYAEMVAHPEIYGENPEGLCAYAYMRQAESDRDGAAVSCALPFMKMKREEYFESHRNGHLAVGSAEDLCRMQRRFIEDQYDDVVADGVGRELRDAHIATFREYIAATGRAFSEHIPELRALAVNAKAFAAKVKALPQPLRQYEKTLFWLRKHWAQTAEQTVGPTATPSVADGSHKSGSNSEWMMCDPSDAESMIVFTVELLKFKANSPGPNSLTTLEALQTKGPYWFLPPKVAVPETTGSAGATARVAEAS